MPWAAPVGAAFRFARRSLFNRCSAWPHSYHPDPTSILRPSPSRGRLGQPPGPGRLFSFRFPPTFPSEGRGFYVNHRAAVNPVFSTPPLPGRHPRVRSEPPGQGQLFSLSFRRLPHCGSPSKGRGVYLHRRVRVNPIFASLSSAKPTWLTILFWSAGPLRPAGGGFYVHHRVPVNHRLSLHYFRLVLPALERPGAIRNRTDGANYSLVPLRRAGAFWRPPLEGARLLRPSRFQVNRAVSCPRQQGTRERKSAPPEVKLPVGG